MACGLWLRLGFVGGSVALAGVAALFGGWMPPSYVVFVTHNTAVNLDSTSGNHFIWYTRIESTGT